MARTDTLRKIVRSLPVVLLALFFLSAGIPKILGAPTQGATVEDFERWGYPDGFRNLVGAAEATGALLLLLTKPRAYRGAPRFWGAILLGATMLGALATHLAHGEAAAALLPLVLFLLASSVAVVERPVWLRKRAVNEAARAPG